MINRDDLNRFSERTRNHLLEAFALNEVVTMAFDYRAGDETTPIASRCGGKPLINDPADWPLDKNRKPMRFWAQINFEDLGGPMGGVKDCPAHGVLMLFISSDYQTFRAKEANWYRLVYKTEDLEREVIEALSDPHSEYALVARRLEYVPPERLHSAVETIDACEREMVEEWLKGWKAKIDERMSDCQQVLGIESAKAQEACVIAAFHANGITFDQTRKADPHYKHLVDAASQWVVLWRLGGLDRLVPGEKRELFVCIGQEDLIKTDFLRCVPVFL
jgi:uncharacterized protein YwqG